MAIVLRLSDDRRSTNFTPDKGNRDHHARFGWQGDREICITHQHSYNASLQQRPHM